MLLSLRLMEWSILMPGTGAEGIFTGYQATKTFDGYLMGYESVLPQILEKTEYENMQLL